MKYRNTIIHRRTLAHKKGFRHFLRKPLKLRGSRKLLVHGFLYATHDKVSNEP